MIKNLLRIFLILLLSNSIYGQQTDDTEFKKPNPIIYFEGFGGFSVMNHFGLTGGAELNYQYKKSLFSFRFSHVTGYIKQDSVFSFNNVEDNNEYALLYGRRLVRGSHSFSVSAGVSCNNLKLTTRFDNYSTYKYENFFGVPFEANFKWYNPKKRSKLIYSALIPSVGVKVFGNVYKNAFFGVGFSLGLGLNKEY